MLNPFQASQGRPLHELAGSLYYMMAKQREARGCRPLVELEAHSGCPTLTAAELDSVVSLAPIALYAGGSIPFGTFGPIRTRWGGIPCVVAGRKVNLGFCEDIGFVADRASSCSTTMFCSHLHRAIMPIPAHYCRLHPTLHDPCYLRRQCMKITLQTCSAKFRFMASNCSSVRDAAFYP